METHLLLWPSNYMPQPQLGAASQPQLTSQPQLGAASQQDLRAAIRARSLARRPGPFLQLEAQGSQTSHPQLGAASQHTGAGAGTQQTGAGAQTGSQTGAHGSQQADLRACSLANKPRSLPPRAHGSQATSHPQAGAISQPQLGIATSQPQLGATSQPQPIAR